MVNIPPIPPLLCSTPPPIDFGEDDEDVDVLPSPLGGVENDFVDFLAEDVIENNDPLPSPTLSAACDVPPISIYDDYPKKVNSTSHIGTSPSSPIDDKIKNIKSNLTETFNFNVKSKSKDTKNVMQNEGEDVCKSPPDILEKESIKCTPPTQEIEPLNIEAVCESSKTNISYKQNVVSIEDIEDDLSDDELYSPKTPKNFLTPDNLNDYFKIEEIKTTNIGGNETKLDSSDCDSKSLNPLDNIESAPLENENGIEFKSFSSNSFIQNKFDASPPDDDDFGEFSDFRETLFVNNNGVPVNDISMNQTIDLDNFNNFNEHNKIENFIAANDSSNKIGNQNVSESEHQGWLKEAENINIEFNGLSLSDKFREEISQENSLYIQMSQETVNENKQKTEEPLAFGNEENNFGDFNVMPDINDKDDFQKFAQFSNSHNINKEAIEKTKEPTKYLKEPSNDDEQFNDFADFESHKAPIKSYDRSLSPGEGEENNNINNDDDDDDDFGDFNTAEPVTTASSSTLTTTSQNGTTETPAMPSTNINERISKILQVMFSLTINSVEKGSDEPQPNKIQDIPFTSIDAAKALEYQWLISDTRHSFIRSLGIDSKNILFGDNWNPSLPRFASNLSFNPLKPMKPAQSTSSTADSNYMLEPIPDNTSETNQTSEVSSGTKKEATELDWKSLKTTEQKIDAFKDNNFAIASSASMCTSYVSNEPLTTEPESSTIFENTLSHEGKLSKTPPISEMEAVTTFSSPFPEEVMGAEMPATQMHLEENFKNILNVDEVVVTSTFTGSFKETHIYTPPQPNDMEHKHASSPPSITSSSPAKASPIDFDYEKAAMGVIIDETVVKKEYRDVEYNPPFTMDSLSKVASSKIDILETNIPDNDHLSTLGSTETNVEDEESSGDDFSEFQSVSSDVVVPPAAIPKKTTPLDVPKSTTVSHGGMILSPAILIPQAISMVSQKPKIEWGDSTAAINPEELARIEELFPEPKSLKSNGSNSSQKTTPTHQVASTPSISATVANKELEGTINSNNDDDEDWSDFVSVTITNNAPVNKAGSNNNILIRTAAASSFQQRSSTGPRIPPMAYSNSNNDDEWSEFVSSVPPLQQSTSYRVPQFNSGAWQHANFYNNPLSMYQKGPMNVPSATSPTNSTQKYIPNNNNYYNNISQQPYQIAHSMPPVMLSNHQQQTVNNTYQQQVHVMQNFSTAPVPTPDRISAAVAASAAKNNQFQSIGSAKVAPSIALIPDLGFVAPAIPTHTSFINSLPKPSINMKK